VLSGRKRKPAGLPTTGWGNAENLLFFTWRTTLLFFTKSGREQVLGRTWVVVETETLAGSKTRTPHHD